MDDHGYVTSSGSLIDALSLPLHGSTTAISSTQRTAACCHCCDNPQDRLTRVMYWYETPPDTAHYRLRTHSYIRLNSSFSPCWHQFVKEKNTATVLRTLTKKRSSNLRLKANNSFAQLQLYKS